MERFGSLLLALAIVHVASPLRTVDAQPAGTERVLDRVDVPDASRKVGEVRLIERGGAAVVETLLDTKLIKRVVAEIRKKELVNWPEGREGHADSQRYIAALERAAADLRGRQPVLDKKADRRVRLFIDFILDAERSTVTIGTYDAERRDGVLQVTVRTPMATLAPARDWVKANMRLIVADSFKLDGAALDAKLAPLPALR